ncbi:ATP-binding protein [Caulobacter sp. BP25]|uniref:hybrid sensor histidine kinase/response regulator n=1 Tax=Caulobacter sp. BP25 TaxID=2048900 RepID=UPI000C12B6B8|nr:ATP-binding protein [Caulobacter sp. BP25]PHY22818.1 hybrid sensor histidine kinase/response regulator [Caulobacter sp. BP25]
MKSSVESTVASEVQASLALGFDALQRPVWVFDDVRKLALYANQAALELWRAPSLDALQARDFSNASPAVRTRMSDLAARLRTGVVEERWTFYPEGEAVTVNTMISRIALPDGGWAMLCEGVRLRPEAEEQRAIEALHHTSALVSLYDAEGWRIFGNPAALAAYPDRGGRFADIFADSDAGEILWSRLQDVEVIEGGYRVITAGGPRWHSLTVRRTPDPMTGRPCVLVNETDITEEVEAQAALADARERAEIAAAARQAFLANMSHELRTPLTSILGFADLLEDATLDDAQMRHLGRIREAGAMLLETLNAVLDFSKLEAGGVDLEHKPFDLPDLAARTAGMFEAAARSKGLSLSIHVAPDCPRWLDGDPERLRHVLVNFLGNAMKFTDSGGVSLAVESRTGARPGMERLELSVSDTGVGVPAEMLDHVFDRFTQAGPEVSRRFGGTGLGLAISREIVELMGGRIGVDSVAGEGARFWCVLDLPVAEPPSVATDEASPVSGRPLRLLVADDNDANRELIGTLVRAMGHQVETVADGIAAVEAVHTRVYDLVLMDVHMPRMDGLAATRAIRDLGGEAASTPIIALTANVLPDQIAFYRASGMDDHVGKPIDPRDLQAKIAAWSVGRTSVAGADRSCQTSGRP